MQLDRLIAPGVNVGGLIGRVAVQDRLEHRDRVGRNVPQSLSADETGAVDAAARAQLLATLPMLWQAASAAPEPIRMLETILNGNPAYKAAGIDIWCDEAVKLHGTLPF